MLKGTVSRDYLLLVSFMNQFPPGLSLYVPLGPFRIFSKIRGDIHSSRFATGVIDTGGKWKKSSIRQIFLISFGHLWEVECQQIDNCFAAGVDGNLPPVSLTPLTPAVNLPPVSLTPEIFVSQGAQPVSTTPVVNLPLVSQR
jgi:hypothetical protein